MTRSYLFLISAIATLAVAVSPAMASDDYGSVTAIMGAEKSAPQPGASGYSSINATLGADPVPLAAVQVAPLESPAAGADGTSGFGWGDALIGALVASLAIALTLTAMRTLRRPTAASRA